MASGYTNAVTVEKGNIVTNNNLFELNRTRPGVTTGNVLLNWID